MLIFAKRLDTFFSVLSIFVRASEAPLSRIDTVFLSPSRRGISGAGAKKAEKNTCILFGMIRVKSMLMIISYNEVRLAST